MLGQNNSGYNNSGHFNSGHRNSGNLNSGNRNSRHCNSGDKNSGDHNSGDRNSGHNNSGYYNSGHFNSGDFNSGNFNSGDYNSGNRNSGDFNSGDFNSGMFNTTEQRMKIFNKELDMTVSEFFAKHSILIYPKLAEWVFESDMTKQEKNDHPKYKTHNGYLKTYGYKEAWQIAWNNATKTQKDSILNLPGFDPKIFYEITGIDVHHNLSGKKVQVILDGKTYTATID